MAPSLCELLTKETTFSDIIANILRSLFPKEMADFNSSIVTQLFTTRAKSDEETKNAMKLIN
nr:hypothetical protein [Escherichia coli]QUN01884.1 stable plasmid inheritance protein B [Escherichia coli]